MTADDPSREWAELERQERSWRRLQAERAAEVELSRAQRAPWQRNPLAAAPLSPPPPTPLEPGVPLGAAELLGRLWAGSDSVPLTLATPRPPRSAGLTEQFEATVGQLDENLLRKERLRAAASIGQTPARADSAQEAARQLLGKALNEAVDSGYLDEQQAVAMIVIGGLNDQPLSKRDARAQLVSALAQAVKSEFLDRASAQRWLTSLAPAGTAPEDQDADLLARAARAAPVPGRAVDESDMKVLVESVPELLARIRARDELLYAALTLFPCHLSEHEGLHREVGLPCSEQSSVLVATLIAGLDLPPSLLPRVVHRDPDGAISACCRSDGRIGTWLRHGQTVAPPATRPS